ncbi:TetR family transcriptional regulator [Nocardia cyriacigeorgica]|uniref:TetR/AcrR family transcriptional regulator n=1 Tax=Nocardia cyriacigeorgica TaxID=135487 RepID=UPI0018955F6C|nr:TetR family transcriptional regulator [Nocardia cyriacigeorgica]MBF6343989.1 TetR family transcriptional regulator [Nocardia cyriacigeorgica]
MFNRPAVSEGSAPDLSTRARIRDAAIAVFGEQGFNVGVRAIATAAGVSPGLVNHHFGSKDGLREECDDYVRKVIRDSKLDSVEHPSPSNILGQLAEIESFGPVIAYIVRSFQAGGALAGTLFEHMVSDVEQYLRAGIAAGTIRAPRDLHATARYLALNNGGGLMLFLQLYAAAHDGPLDYGKALRAYADQMLLPGVELFTNGLLTSPMMLDALLDQSSPDT